MTEIPTDLFYTKDHEWIKKESDGSCLIGITYHAQDSLGDVTFVELPSVGESFDQGSVFGVVESCNNLSSAASCSPTRSSRVLRIWPSLIKVGPSSVKAKRSRQAWLICSRLG